MVDSRTVLLAAHDFTRFWLKRRDEAASATMKRYYLRAYREVLTIALRAKWAEAKAGARWAR